jgi:ribosomal protein S17
MATIPKKVIERYKKTVPHYQRILAVARDRDVNEADTVSIIQGILVR